MNKHTLFNIALAIHIFFGGVALVIAPLAMVTVKGGLWHRRWGKIYFWSMAGVALSATLLCWLRSGLFLFLIAIFSFYLALTGYRVLRRKRPDAKAGIVDWFAAIAMLLSFKESPSTEPVTVTWCPACSATLL